jgi:DNA-directed RNA polymerase subunit RPC12/RpoP
MAKHLLCPDCGGIIGATEATEEGHPCECFGGTNHSLSDTDRIDSPVSASERAAAVAPVSKICFSCGTDTTGHRRIKDSRGYQCYACAKEERRSEIGGTVKCPECGRRVRGNTLRDYDGHRICVRCVAHRKEVKRKSARKVATQSFQRHEKKQLKWLLLVLAVLALIVTLNLLDFI